MSSKRIHAVSVARAAGILLVLVGHAEPIQTLSPGLWAFLSYFRMPLFFFISGLVMNPAAKRGSMAFPDYWKKYCRPYILPYLVINLVFAAIKMAIPDSVQRPIDPSSLFVQILFFPWEGPAMYLWFIYALFVMRHLLFFLAALPKPLLAVLMAAFIILSFPDLGFLALGTVLRFLPFYLAGSLLSSRKEAVIASLKKPLLIPVSAALFVFLFLKPLTQVPVSVFSAVMGFLGVIFVLSVTACVSDRIPPRLIKPLVDYGLEIYLLQFFFIFPASRGLLAAGVPPFAVVPVTFTLGLMGPIFLSKYVFPRSRAAALLFCGRAHDASHPASKS